jgi:hypothetical protein
VSVVPRIIFLLVILLTLVAPAFGDGFGIPHPTLPECIAGDPRLMLPDLYPQTPSDVRNSRKLGRRKMEFTSKVANIGAGPLILEGMTVSDETGVFTHAWQIIRRRDGTECARTAGRFVYHPQHTHYHVDRFVSYELRQDDPITGALVGTGWKASFCLLDSENLPGYPDSVYPQTRGLSCGTPSGRQGISVGWQDVYERHLPDQNIDLDGPHPVIPGPYWVKFEVDPEKRLWELTRDNNISFTTAGVTLSLPDRDSRANQPPIMPDNAVPIKPSRPPVPPGGTAAPTTAPNIPPTPVPPATRPTKPPRPPKPTRWPRLRPEKPPRPTKPPRGGTTTEPTPVPPSQATPTPTTAVPNVPPPSGSCSPTCAFSLKQMRMTWLAQTGLSLTGSIDLRGCPSIALDGDRPGYLNTYNWMTENFESDTGIQHNTTFVLHDGAGETSSGGRFIAAESNGKVQFAYTLSGPPPANAEDGSNFPVVFNFCMGVGDQVIGGYLVCQPKATGLLCHE